MANTEGIASQRRLLAREREKEAYAMKRGGATYQAIGDALGVSKQAVAMMIKRVLIESREEMQGDIDEVRTLELSRLEGLLFMAWRLAIKGNLGAIDRVEKIIRAQREILGIDAPKKSELTGKDGSPLMRMVEAYANMSDEELVERVGKLITGDATIKPIGEKEDGEGGEE
jgi:hypothetical protein